MDPGLREIAKQVAQLLREDPPVPRRWLTPREAAQYLSLKTATLEKQRRDGTGPKYARVNHQIVRYDIHELDRFMEGAQA